MVTIKEELPVSGIRQIAVIYGKLPSCNSKLPSRVVAALAWRGALSSLPFLILNKEALLTNITITYSSSRY